MPLALLRSGVRQKLSQNEGWAVVEVWQCTTYVRYRGSVLHSPHVGDRAIQLIGSFRRPPCCAPPHQGRKPNVTRDMSSVVQVQYMWSRTIPVLAVYIAVQIYHCTGDRKYKFGPSRLLRTSFSLRQFFTQTQSVASITGKTPAFCLILMAFSILACLSNRLPKQYLGWTHQPNWFANNTW